MPVQYSRDMNARYAAEFKNINRDLFRTISDNNKKALKKIIKAIISKDYKEVTRQIINMSKPLEEIDYQKLESDVTNILEDYSNIELENIDIPKFIKDMFNMLRNNHLMLDKDVTMIVRGDAVIEGVLKKLNPKISFLNVLALSEDTGINELLSIENIKDTSRRIVGSINNLIDIPKEVTSLLKSINTGQTKFKVELSESANQVDKLENLVHELIIGFVDGCLVIACSIVNDINMKSLFFALIILLTIWLLAKMIKDLMHRGY